MWRRYGSWASLGTVGDTYVHGMNQRGHVIGDDQHGVQGGFLWQGRRLTYLTMPDMVVWATAVSDHDQVVGDLSFPNEPGLQAFSWRNGSFTRLPTPDGLLSYAVDVNERGQVLGTLVDSDWSTRQGAVWDRGRLTLVGGPDTTVRAINNRGQVIGLTDGRPFRWTAGRLRDLLAGTGATSGFARAINDDGVIAGFADWRPVAWKGRGMQYLVPPGYGGAALWVNRRGDVAGVAYPGVEPENQESVLFRWRDGAVTYYGGAPGSQVVLLGMDEAGRLVGFVDDGTSRELVTWAL